MSVTEQLQQNELPKRIRGAGEQVPQKNAEQMVEEHAVAVSGLRAVGRRLALGRLANSRQVQVPSEGIDRMHQASKFRRIISKLPARAFEQSPQENGHRDDAPVSYFAADKNYEPSHKASGGKHALELTDAKTVREVFQNDVKPESRPAGKHARPMFSYEISGPVATMVSTEAIPTTAQEPMHRGVQGMPLDAEGKPKEYPEYQPGGAHKLIPTPEPTVPVAPELAGYQPHDSQF